MIPKIYKTVKTDMRGFVLILEIDKKEYLLLFTKAGVLRGGEIHVGKQYNVVLKGKMRWTIGFVNDKTVRTFEKNELIVTSADTPHMMEALTDTLMLEWREFPIEQPVNYYEPYRSLIRERMKKSGK